MKDNMMNTVIKGMLVGAVVGAGAAYVSGLDLTCKCRKVKRKVCAAYKLMRRKML